ncbi:hypothetical protein [Streptosporangium sp. NBC_01756]|uniref:hypothetical protein n=1 Tax=Streptosporangium sp. NBC_01756 TaxID=2975950 RepID=UPI002DD8DE75|nr:hypothetical protein [Streptosporangium sp. NBC_01756]WSC86287.1 hypothetical protein OIE48_39035 [Streptosporangium sp. NBC_01756]
MHEIIETTGDIAGFLSMLLGLPSAVIALRHLKRGTDGNERATKRENDQPTGQ